MKTLDLVLSHKWYDMIEHGGKREEYREATLYWAKRICKYGKLAKVCIEDCTCKLPSCQKSVPTDKEYVRFHRGYTKTTMMFKLDGIRYGLGQLQWGAPILKNVYCLLLGERVG